MRNLLRIIRSASHRRQPRRLPTRHGSRQQGSAVIEITLLAPWVFFLFVGILDMGFYTYSLIAVENASRVGAEYTSKSSSVAADQADACTAILAELASLPRVSGLSTCSGAPLTVTANSVLGTDGSQATSVSVTYQSNTLIPIPGLLARQLNVTRTTQMRVMQ